MTTDYIPLSEYSSKYKVSISTLRRKIKTSEIEFRFDQGRYYILDSSGPANLPIRSSQSVEPSPSLKRNEQDVQQASTKFRDIPLQVRMPSTVQKDESVLVAANNLLQELKTAYTRILQEKEEQILHLKEEVSDLKTLVKVLESDNERMKRR